MNRIKGSSIKFGFENKNFTRYGMLYIFMFIKYIISKINLKYWLPITLNILKIIKKNYLQK